MQLVFRVMRRSATISKRVAAIRHHHMKSKNRMHAVWNNWITTTVVSRAERAAARGFTSMHHCQVMVDNREELLASMAVQYMVGLACAHAFTTWKMWVPTQHGDQCLGALKLRGVAHGMAMLSCSWSQWRAFRCYSSAMSKVTTLAVQLFQHNVLGTRAAVQAAFRDWAMLLTVKREREISLAMVRRVRDSASLPVALLRLSRRARGVWQKRAKVWTAQLHADLDAQHSLTSWHLWSVVRKMRKKVRGHQQVQQHQSGWGIIMQQQGWSNRRKSWVFRAFEAHSARCQAARLRIQLRSTNLQLTVTSSLMMTAQRDLKQTRALLTLQSARARSIQRASRVAVQMSCFEACRQQMQMWAQVEITRAFQKWCNCVIKLWVAERAAVYNTAVPDPTSAEQMQHTVQEAAKRDQADNDAQNLRLVRLVMDDMEIQLQHSTEQGDVLTQQLSQMRILGGEEGLLVDWSQPVQPKDQNDSPELLTHPEHRAVAFDSQFRSVTQNSPLRSPNRSPNRSPPRSPKAYLRSTVGNRVTFAQPTASELGHTAVESFNGRRLAMQDVTLGDSFVDQNELHTWRQRDVETSRANNPAQSGSSTMTLADDLEQMQRNLRSMIF